MGMGSKGANLSGGYPSGEFPWSEVSLGLGSLIIVTLSEKLGIKWVNPAGLKIFNAKLTEICKKSLLDFITRENRPPFKACLRSFKSEPVESQIHFVNTAGKRIFFHGTLARIPRKEKGWVLVGWDETRLEQVSDELNGSRNLVSLISKTTQEALLVADRDLKIFMANDAAYELLGKDPQSLLGKALHESLRLFDPSTKQRLDLLGLLKKGKSLIPNAVMLGMPKGTERNVRCKLESIQGKGRGEEFVLSLLDISEYVLRERKAVAVCNQTETLLAFLHDSVARVTVSDGKIGELIWAAGRNGAIQKGLRNLIDKNQLGREILKTSLSGIPWQGKWRTTIPGGLERQFKVSILRFEPGFVTVVLDDVTISESYLRQEKERNKRYSMMLESITDGVLILRQGKVVFFNSRLKEIFGHDNSLEQGKKFVWKKWVRGNERVLVAKILDDFSKKVRKRSELFLWIYPDEDVRKFLSCRLSVSDSDQDTVYAVVSDMTGWVSIQNERDRFFNYSMDLLAISAFDGFFKEVNPSWNRLLHWDEKTLLERPWIDFVHPEDKELALAHSNKVISGISPDLSELRFRCKDGTYRWLSWSSIALPEEKLVFSIVRDMTERKKWEYDLRQSEKMESIGRLAAGVAHDFNNQLTGILGGADILKDMAVQKPECAECNKYAEIIVRSAQRASQLTNQLLSFAKKGKFQSVNVDLHLLLRDVETILQHTVDKIIKIVFQLDADRHNIMGDPLQLKNALISLAVNACDAMPNGGVLSIVTRSKTRPRNQPEVSVLIRDTGKGIDAETMKHIFEPFYTTKFEGHATGMGLPAVYGILESHSGTIDVTSDTGKGTLVTLNFPAVDPEISPTKEVLQRNPQGVPISHILVVDDEESVLEIVSKMLADLGYSVSTCSNGRQAVELFQEHKDRFDLVLLDMIMPEMNGSQTFQVLKKINPKVRVVICSGYSLNDEIDKLLKSGAVSFIQKPFLKSTLAQMLSLISKKPTINST